MMNDPNCSSQNKGQDGIQSTDPFHAHQLGMVAQEQQRLEDAIAHFQQALALFESAGDLVNAAAAYHQLGLLAQRQRRLEDAISFFKNALSIFTASGDLYKASYPSTGLAEIATEQGHLDQSAEYYRQAFDARSAAQDWPRASSTLNQWAQVLETQHQWAEAMHLYMQALAIDVDHNQQCFQLNIWDLGRMLNQLGPPKFDAVWRNVAGQSCPAKLYAKISASTGMTCSSDDLLL